MQAESPAAQLRRLTEGTILWLLAGFGLLPLSLLAQRAPPCLLTDTAVVVTYRDQPVHPEKSAIPGRVQLLPDPATGRTTVFVTNCSKLPSSCRRLILKTNARANRRLKHRDITQLSADSMEVLLRDYRQDSIRYKATKHKADLIKGFPKNAQKFYAGENGGDFFTANWVPLGSADILPNAGRLSLDVKGRFSRQARYETRVLPAGYALAFPALDTARCGPGGNRWFDLRKMPGYDLGSIRYVRYRAPDREVVRRSFELHFSKNSTQANADGLRQISAYLKQHHYSVLSVAVEGYASPEGDAQHNQALQEKRAHFLLATLQKDNSEPIALDTIIVAPTDDQFRTAIKKTAFRWLDTLTNEQLRATINANQPLLDQLEPILAPQRKATLRLDAARRLDAPAALARFRRDLAYWGQRLEAPNRRDASPPEAERRVMGLLAHLFTLVETGRLSARQAEQLLDSTSTNEMMPVLAVYHVLLRFGKPASRKAPGWQKLIASGWVNRLFVSAHAGLTRLLDAPDLTAATLDKRKRMLVDLQTYTFDWVRDNLLPDETVCAMTYPDNPRFRGYKLRYLKLMQELAQVRAVPCGLATLSFPPSYSPYNDAWLKKMKQASKEVSSRPTASLCQRQPPHFEGETASPLLFFLKKLLVSDEESIKQHAVDFELYDAVDIMLLLDYHVNAWEPLTNTFVDPDVQLEAMHKLTARLRKADQTTCCPQQLNQLYLDYHLKALQFIARYAEPGNETHAQIAQQSLAFIAAYYGKRASLVTPPLADYLLRQLNQFYWVPGAHEGSWYAWQLLQSISKQRALSASEQTLWDAYSVMYR